MATPASFKNHPLHPILVSIPFGLWTFAFVCDLIHAFGGTGLWGTVALYCVAGGVVGAVVAAVPGLIDYFFIDEADMKRIATMHLLASAGKPGRRHRFCGQSVDEIPRVVRKPYTGCFLSIRNGGGRLRWGARWRDGLREGYGCRSGRATNKERESAA